MSFKDLVPKFGKSGSNMPVRRKEDDRLVSFQHEMNRLFDDFFNGFGLTDSFGWDNQSLMKSSFAPKVDVSETKKEVKISAELPGMEEKDVEIELGDDSLIIRGEKIEEKEDKGSQWYTREQSYGSFHRVIPLPASVEGDKAKAKFKKGKLTVTIPKTSDERLNRKTIKIESE